MPGANWSDTAYEPLYTKACIRDSDAAAKFYGIILWVVMMDRPEAWLFGRYQLDGVPIKGLTYFCPDCPKALVA